MKFLLTSAGIKNPSIHNALLDLLGKPIAESSALCIPTATYALPGGAAGAALAWRFISGQEPICPICELGWKFLGVLDAAVRAGRPLAVAARSLRGAERREPGDGTQHREGLRPLDSAHRWR